jgi:replicative DNA helicase
MVEGQASGHARRLAAVASEEATALPQNQGAEEKLIGALLLSGASGAEPSRITAERVKATGLEPADFWSARRGTIYRAALTVAGQGLPMEALLVIDELRRRGELVNVGGESYIRELCALASAISNAGHYAQLVKDEAWRRRQLAFANALRAELEGGGDLLENVELQEQARALLAPSRDSVALEELDLAAMLDGPIPEVEWLWHGWIERGDLTAVLELLGIPKQDWVRG